MPALLAAGCGELARDPAVVLVTVDGLRWQEVFRGADSSLFTAAVGGTDDWSDVRDRFWRPTATARREALMPFFWRTVADSGQVFGNQGAGSAVRVLNGRNFSYPGYQEILAGFPDDRIDSNDKHDNPNVSVLEWLHAQPGFQGMVAAFGSWDVFPFILNEERAGFLVNAGWEAYDPPERALAPAWINAVAAGLPVRWPDIRYDALTLALARFHAMSEAPRVLYVALDEPDSQAHAGRYDQYLDAVRRIDEGLRLLWEDLQSHAAYRGRTTLILTADHGRGVGAAWTDHGADVAGAEFTWWAVIGPRTPSRGIMTEREITLGQTAATLAWAVEVDYAGAVPAAAPPVDGAVVP